MHFSPSYIFPHAATRSRRLCGIAELPRSMRSSRLTPLSRLPPEWTAANYTVLHTTDRPTSTFSGAVLVAAA